MTKWYSLSVRLMGCMMFAAPVMCQAADTDRIRFYLAVRLGGAFLTDTHLPEGVRIDSVAAQQAIAGSVGLNLGRHWGVEIAGEGYEANLRMPQVGKIGEYAVWTIIPQLRWRYPLLEGMLTPYVVGGVGVGFTEFNDQTPGGAQFSVTAQDKSVIGALGVGIDYFVVSNIAVGMETKFLLFRDADFKIDGQGRGANLDAFVLTGGLRIFFP